MNEGRNIALILAGGHGARMHSETPKQFLTLRGMPVIMYSLSMLERHPLIDEVAVVCLQGWEAYVQGLVRAHRLTKIRHIFTGGEESHISICNGIRGLCSCGARKTDVVLVHEAVRPLVSARIVSDCIRVCRSKGNAITAIRDNEALMYTEDGCVSDACFSRENMFRAQTPHTFFLDTLQQAYARAERCGIKGQSLYTLMAELGYGPFNIVEGDRRNFKLTHPEDFRVAEVMIEHFGPE